jgi:hypothetical protein
MAAYGSQIQALFGSAAEMRSRVRRAVSKIDGERYWQRV